MKNNLSLNLIRDHVIEITLGATDKAPGVRHWFMGVVEQTITNKTTGLSATMRSNKWTDNFTHLVEGAGIFTKGECIRYLPIIDMDGCSIHYVKEAQYQYERDHKEKEVTDEP